jgi:hypothetical protein
MSQIHWYSGALDLRSLVWQTEKEQHDR